MSSNYICALSGRSPAAEEMPESGGLPEGWVRILVQRKLANPRWEVIQEVKQGLFLQSMEALPEEEREANIANVAIQIEAQYSHLETVTGEFVEEEEEAYIAPPESDTALFSEYNKLRLLLGFEEEVLEEELADEVEDTLTHPITEEEEENA